MKRLNENEIIKKLKTLDIPQLKISIKEFVSPNKRFQSGSTPDLFIYVVWSNETWPFYSVIKTVATPKLIAAAVSQLDMFRKASESGPYPMIVHAVSQQRAISGISNAEHQCDRSVGECNADCPRQIIYREDRKSQYISVELTDQEYLSRNKLSSSSSDAFAT